MFSKVFVLYSIDFNAEMTLPRTVVDQLTRPSVYSFPKIPTPPISRRDIHKFSLCRNLFVIFVVVFFHHPSQRMRATRRLAVACSVTFLIELELSNSKVRKSISSSCAPSKPCIVTSSRDPRKNFWWNFHVASSSQKQRDANGYPMVFSELTK